MMFVGISGWNFDGWRGTFYPDGLKQDQELAYCSRKLRSIEVNGTFYSLFRPASFQNWYQQSPADFQFAIKGPKYITHERRLKRFETPLANFLASGILALKEKLGPILWQFPPNMKFDAELFEAFMKALPHDMETAAGIARGHSDWMEERAYLQVDGNFRMRHAIEGRHESFRCPEFVTLARRYNVAIVVGDTAGRWPLIEDLCTDFVYLRLHADETKYPEGYGKASLMRWAERFKLWSAGEQPEDAAVVMEGQIEKIPRSVYAYFDNDVKETAPLNALSILSLLLQEGVIEAREFEDLPAPGLRRFAKKKTAEAGVEKVSARKKESAEGVARRERTTVGRDEEFAEIDAAAGWETDLAMRAPVRKEKEKKATTRKKKATVRELAATKKSKDRAGDEKKEVATGSKRQSVKKPAVGLASGKKKSVASEPLKKGGSGRDSSEKKSDLSKAVKKEASPVSANAKKKQSAVSERVKGKKSPAGTLIKTKKNETIGKKKKSKKKARKKST